LGFGGIGGAAMTTAYTIVLECGRQRAVYFGGRFAYLVDQPNQAMLDDITKQQMAKVGESKKYERSTKLPEKREWCYVIPPKVFEVAPCDCGNHETMWSEYKGKIWCPICEKDFTPQHNGVFDDQIPAKLATILGLSFDRYIIATGVVEKYDTKQLGWVKEVRTGNAI